MVRARLLPDAGPVPEICYSDLTRMECRVAPLARAEVAVILDRFLEHTSAITLSEARHGPKDARRIDYEPSFIIRGLAAMNLKLTPSAAFTHRKPG